MKKEIRNIISKYLICTEFEFDRLANALNTLFKEEIKKKLKTQRKNIVR